MRRASNEADDEVDDETRQGRRQHVFAINHDPAFLEVVRELLQDEAYHVTTTNFVPRTWDQIAALQPTLLLIDVIPMEQAAWALLEHLHEQGITNRIPIILTSTDPLILERAEREKERYGGDRFLTTPFDIDTLLAAIRTLIDPA